MSVYYHLLIKERLSREPIEKIVSEVKKFLTVSEVPLYYLRYGCHNLGGKLTDYLSNLPLYIFTGHKNWSGLVVCFPGKEKDLRSERGDASFFDSILLPILDLRYRIESVERIKIPCIYLVGDAFPEASINKLRILRSIVPNLIFLTSDLLKATKSSCQIFEATDSDEMNEDHVRKTLCKMMMRRSGLAVQLRHGATTLGYIANELKIDQGVREHNRLDILAYDRMDGRLVVLKINPSTNKRNRLGNLFIQGIPHYSWVEEHKHAVKLLYEGPNGRKINTQKPVRLIHGFMGDNVPSFFHILGTQSEQSGSNPIDCLRISHEVNGRVSIGRF